MNVAVLVMLLAGAGCIPAPNAGDTSGVTDVRVGDARFGMADVSFSITHRASADGDARIEILLKGTAGALIDWRRVRTRTDLSVLDWPQTPAASPSMSTLAYRFTQGLQATGGTGVGCSSEGPIEVTVSLYEDGALVDTVSASGTCKPSDVEVTNFNQGLTTPGGDVAPFVSAVTSILIKPTFPSQAALDAAKQYVIAVQEPTGAADECAGLWKKDASPGRNGIVTLGIPLPAGSKVLTPVEAGPATMLVYVYDAPNVLCQNDDWCAKAGLATTCVASPGGFGLCAPTGTPKVLGGGCTSITLEKGQQNVYPITLTAPQ